MNLRAAVLSVFVSTVVAIYVPESGTDWRRLRPTFQAEGYHTLPIEFGITVSAVDGEAVGGLNTYQEAAGQIRASSQAAVDYTSVENESPLKRVSCVTDTTLRMRLQDGILRDSNDRIGTIVSSRQFQFDGPTPQFGAVYAAGWLLSPTGHLVLGNQEVFYQCVSGDFYNLYDQPVAYQCNPVTLDVVGLVEC